MQEAALGLEGEVAEAAQPIGELLVIGQDHAALAGRHELVGVEAEAAELAEAAASPPAFAAIVAADRYSAPCASAASSMIASPCCPGEPEDRVHVHRMPVDVDRHDGPRPAGDPGLDLRDVHAPGLRVGVDQDRRRPRVDDRQRARDDREGRQDDLVARADAEGRDGQLQGDRPVGDRDAVSAPAVLGPGRLERVDEAPARRDPAGLEALGDVLRLALAEDRAR